MANVPTTKLASAIAIHHLAKQSGLPNIAAKIMQGIGAMPTVKVPTDNRQPKARVNALKAIPPHGKQL